MNKLLYTSEGMLCSLMIVIGSWLLNPFWDVLTAYTPYAPMKALAATPVWGIILLVTGAAKLIAMLTSDRNMRILAGFLATILWIFLDVLLLIGNSRGFAPVVFAIVSVYSLSILYHTIREPNVR